MRLPGMLINLLVRKCFEIFDEIGAVFRVRHAYRHKRSGHALDGIGDEFVKGAFVPKDSRFAQCLRIVKAFEDAGLAADNIEKVRPGRSMLRRIAVAADTE